MSIMALITWNSIGTNEHGQSLITDMTETTMPKSGGRCRSSEGKGAGWREEWVKVSRAIAPGDHTLCLKILLRKAEGIKLNGTIIISSETAN
jgi:hypothetical protein